nr:hypothetical protein CFP56_41257 [Quercus suber]
MSKSDQAPESFTGWPATGHRFISRIIARHNSHAVPVRLQSFLCPLHGARAQLLRGHARLLTFRSASDPLRRVSKSGESQM